MRPTPFLTTTLLLFSASLLPAQTPPAAPAPVEVKYSDTPKLLTPRIAIHADNEPEPPGLTPIQKAMRSEDYIFGNMNAVILDVVVNQNGRVDSAHATRGPQRFFAQAEDIALHRAYAPALIDGNIARARFEDFVSIYPKEKWSDRPVPFPATPDLSTLSISLQRTGCMGSCPAYTVGAASVVDDLLGDAVE